MYRITCDGYPILDTRDESLIVKNPRVKLSDNTVGEASFTIYKNHPNYDKLGILKSIFEISDEFGVIFRGRMTENSKNIKKGKAVDLEGAMAFFNDSVVRPYIFPDDWEKEDHPNHSEYIIAKLSGNIVEFYLSWLIAQHNAQVSDFQKLKIGTVDVKAKNNKIERSSSDYPSTFEEIKSKTIDSSLGGHLCIRYDEDGNHIDYLAEFTEVNTQGIVYGENLLDFSQIEDGKETYTAIIPRGEEKSDEEETGENYEGDYGTIVGTQTVKKRLTIADLPDKNVTGDIIKLGDMLYSQSAVAAYGWRFVPASESLWDDITVAENLQSAAVEVLQGKTTRPPTTIECKAVDLHYTDSEIRSFRMYKKIPVRVVPHSIYANFDITTLDLDLLNPQNTSITAGRTVMSMTDLQDKRKNDITELVTTQLKESYKTTSDLIDSSIKTVMSEVDTKISSSIEGINLSHYVKTETLKEYATKDTVYTKEEVNNQISLSIDGINLSSCATKVELYTVNNNLNTKFEDYYTKEETEGKISVGSEYVINSVTQTLTDYAKTTEMNSAIETAVGKIDLSVEAFMKDIEGNIDEYVNGKLALTIETDSEGRKYSQLGAEVDKMLFRSGEIDIRAGNTGLLSDSIVRFYSGAASETIGTKLTYNKSASVFFETYAKQDSFTIPNCAYIYSATVTYNIPGGGSGSVDILNEFPFYGDTINYKFAGNTKNGTIYFEVVYSESFDAKFLVLEDGSLFAEKGHIGGWEIEDSCLSSVTQYYHDDGKLYHQKVELSPIGITVWRDETGDFGDNAKKQNTTWYYLALAANSYLDYSSNWTPV